MQESLPAHEYCVQVAIVVCSRHLRSLPDCKQHWKAACTHLAVIDLHICTTISVQYSLSTIIYISAQASPLPDPAGIIHEITLRFQRLDKKAGSTLAPHIFSRTSREKQTWHDTRTSEIVIVTSLVPPNILHSACSYFILYSREDISNSG